MLGLNALIKSNDDKKTIMKMAPPPAIVTINTSGECYFFVPLRVILNSYIQDIYNAGVAATTAAILIAVASFTFFVAPMLPFTRNIAAKTQRLQGFVFVFTSIFLFSAMIPYMVFFANRSAGVSATIGGVPLPASIIKGVEAQTGVTSVYSKISYCESNTHLQSSALMLAILVKIFAVVPWFTFLFSVISAIVLLTAPSTSTSTRTTSHGSSSPVMKEKEQPSHREVV